MRVNLLNDQIAITPIFNLIVYYLMSMTSINQL